MKKHVWVIEMLVGRQWHPCADCALTISSARGYNKLRQWRENNPSDKFRIKKYIRIQP